MYLRTAALLMLLAIISNTAVLADGTIHDFARLGHAEEIRAYLAAGHEPNARDEDRRTILYWAASHGHVEIVRMLLDAGADPLLAEEGDATPLSIAVGHNRAESARLLLEHGAMHTLYTSAGLGDLDPLRGFIEAGADVNALDQFTGNAPLHWAASNGEANAIKLLMEAGAEMDQRSETGVTPLHEAVFRRHPEAARALVEAGANIEAPVDGGWYLVGEGRSYRRYHPLHIAARNGQPQIVRLLLDYGADPNAQVAREGDPAGPAGPAGPWPGWCLTPLHVASQASSSGYYRQFQRRFGWSWIELVQMLIETGADVNALDAAGRTPLQITGGVGPIADALRAAGAR